MFGRPIKEGNIGNKVSISLSCGSERSIVRGMVAASPGSLKLFRRFKAQITINDKDEGGENLQNGHCPLFTFRSETVHGKLKFEHVRLFILPSHMVMPISY